MKKLNYRLVIFLLATFFGIAFSIPSFIGKQPRVNLGLDLQGGMYLVLGVKQDEAIKNKIKTIASTIKYISEKKELFIDNLKIENKKITFELIDKDDEKKWMKNLKVFLGLKLKNFQKMEVLSIL